MVAGAFAEVGGGFWFSNAKSVRDLAGPFQTGHYNLIFVALQVDKGDNGVRVFSFTMGPGGGRTDCVDLYFPSLLGRRLGVHKMARFGPT